MKLARPDVVHPRIVVTGAAGSGDGDGVLASLRRRGLHAVRRSWRDPETLRADVVILAAGEDHAVATAEFLDWTARVPRLLNAPDVVAWNTGDRYLRDLDRAGVPTLAGGRGHDTTALVFLGGAASHAFTTGSMTEPDFALWDLGRAALAAAAAHLRIGAAELLYARADVAGGPAEARLVALDLVAPPLGWGQLDPHTRDLQQRRFALCAESALDRLGLGPLSHRRP
jgi:hypothetical protein